MFGIGFSEIVLIMLVALVVLGPERLPGVARTLGALWGRAQRYLNQVKAEVAHSMELEDLENLKRKAEAEAQALERSMQQMGYDAELEARHLQRELADAAQTAEPSTPGKAT